MCALPMKITRLGIPGTFASADRVYDGTDAAAATDRALVGAVKDDKVSLSGGTATFESRNVGDRTATLAGAALAGDDKGNYTLTSVAPASAKITALAVTGKFTAADKVYDGDVKAEAGGRELVGTVKDDKVSLTGGTATFDSRNVGNRTGTLTGAEVAGDDKGNYTLTSVATASAKITALTITGKFASADKVYDGTVAAVATDRALVGAVKDDKVTLTGGTATFGSKNVGDRTVTLAGAELAGEDKGNYTLTGVADATATITAKGLTGSFKAADKVYDGNRDATITDRALDGVVGQEKVTLSGGTATFGDKNVGDRTVTLTGAELAGEDKGNYTLTSVAPAPAKITALAVTGTFASADKVYDGTTAARGADRALVGAIKDDQVSVTGGTATFGDKNVGDRTVTLTGAELAGDDKDNYTLTSVAPAPAKITALAVTGTFASADKVYDGTDAAAATDRALVGAVKDDKVSLSGGTATFDSRNVGDRTATLAGPLLAGDDKGNYTLTSVATASAKITRLGITGTFASADRVYDGTDAAAATDRALVGAVKDDKVSLSGGTAAFDSRNVRAGERRVGGGGGGGGGTGA